MAGELLSGLDNVGGRRLWSDAGPTGVLVTLVVSQRILYAFGKGGLENRASSPACAQAPVQLGKRCRSYN